MVTWIHHLPCSNFEKCTFKKKSFSSNLSFFIMNGLGTRDFVHFNRYIRRKAFNFQKSHWKITALLDSPVHWFCWNPRAAYRVSMPRARVSCDASKGVPDSHKVGSMLVHHPRGWPNIELTLCECLMFAGQAGAPVQISRCIAHRPFLSVTFCRAGQLSFLLPSGL